MNLWLDSLPLHTPLILSTPTFQIPCRIWQKYLGFKEVGEFSLYPDAPGDHEYNIQNTIQNLLYL